jgi:hypothetical protein
VLSIVGSVAHDGDVLATPEEAAASGAAACGTSGFKALGALIHRGGG